MTKAEEFAVAFLAAKSGDAAPVGVDRVDRVDRTVAETKSSRSCNWIILG